MPKQNIKIWRYSFAFLLLGCSTVKPLRQGYFINRVPSTIEKVDCILSNDIFYSTTDYILIQCGKSVNDFFYIPTNLKVESDINNRPLVFSQFVRNACINLIVNTSYEKEKFIEAFVYLKSLNANYSLHMVPINSVSVIMSTIIPDRRISYYGITDSGIFGSHVIFNIRGKTQINSMRTLLLSSNGFQMLYQFRYLIEQNGTLVQKIMQIPIYINGINF